MSEAAALIQVSGIKKVYKMSGNVRVNALNGVSFRVERGAFIAIMGTSGSGKSTLLHLIAGVDTPTSGTVRIDGQDIHRLKPSGKARLRRRSVGIIYQDYNLIPTLTVEENIILPILLDRRKPDKGEVERLLELLQLKDRRRHLPGQLSGGQQQRTAIGRVLLEKPSVLLADEPTGNLDSQNTEEVLGLLRKANRDLGQTILLVTHDISAGRVAGRQIIMSDGRILSDIYRADREADLHAKAPGEV